MPDPMLQLRPIALAMIYANDTHNPAPTRRQKPKLPVLLASTVCNACLCEDGKYIAK
jgi:hypothetical protein